MLMDPLQDQLANTPGVTSSRSEHACATAKSSRKVLVCFGQVLEAGYSSYSFRV
jgi:hypothetical protein